MTLSEMNVVEMEIVDYEENETISDSDEVEQM